MISKAIRVRKDQISQMLDFLKSRGLLASGLRIKKEDDHAVIPVKEVPEGYEPLEEDFEQLSRRKSYMDLVNIPDELRVYLPRSMDIVGHVAIIKIDEKILPYSSEIARAIMAFNKSIRTVALDRGVRGEFRVRDLEVIGGDGLETVHRENGVRIYVDLKNVYFSPRLAKERARVLSLVRDNEIIHDLFCGSGAFSILIGKKRNVKIYSVDKNPYAIEGLKRSMELNRITNIFPVLGDVRDVMGVLPHADRAILDLPMESVRFLGDVIHRANYFHIYYKCDSPEDAVREIESKGLIVDRYGLVHGYSPREGMYYFDARKGD
ncbi:MAG: class I SAM-dependent methyltransferase [Thermoplasmata archaeon]|nr:MAG: class I SAM-dependent methyltransferase family protein [Aciduliprofundum sp.]PMP75721.1 MAG: class I SAM-dependent methyltransferase family protein [Aciduliprofundum sp.]